MKARVEILIRDEEGNRLSQLDPYQMDLGSQSLHDIEGAVEHWRQQALPDIEAELLRQAQSQFTQQGKNRELICNGTRPVCIKTLHGQFRFPLQTYQFQGQGTSYLQVTHQLREGYVSPRLQELCGYYSNRLSYEEVAGLVERVSGKPLLSDQTIWHIVKTKAEALSQKIRQSVERTFAQANPPLMRVNPQLDLYDPAQRETLVFDDGIQVKGQSENRHSKAKVPEKKWRKGPSQSKTPAITTNIVMLQKATGDFEYITAPLDDTGENALSLATVVGAKVMQFYGSEPHPLNLVAITDGARAIRNRMLAVFGVAVVILLDWYHLCKKLRDFMSMIAVNKTEKSRHLKFLLPQLWQGKTTIVLEYLKTQVTARNQDKCEELIGYLERHQQEIIDYNRRSKAGKTIGSGRMEKGVDLAVGRRQKKKAMSWRPRGSKALSLLKVAELNGQWQQLWFPAQPA